MRGLLATVIIPCLNDKDGLEAALRAVSDQDCRDQLKVVVADNGSTDDSREVAAHLADATVVSWTKGAAHARNEALAITETPFVLTLDADCIPLGRDWAVRHIQALNAQPRAFGSAGAILPLPSADWWAKRPDVTPHPRFADAVPLYSVGANACYRTDLLKKLGGFPLYQADDAALGNIARARGFEYVWTPGARVYHRNSRGWLGYYRQMCKVGGYAAELNGRPSSWFRYFAGRLRAALASGRYLVALRPREATAGMLRAIAQTHGAIRVWRS